LDRGRRRRLANNGRRRDSPRDLPRLLRCWRGPRLGGGAGGRQHRRKQEKEPDECDEVEPDADAY